MFNKRPKSYLSISEAVSCAHPDMLAEVCAAIVIDDIQHNDKFNSHAAIEVFLTHDTIIYAGEATTTLKLDLKYLRNVTVKAFRLVGYIPEMRKYWSKQEVCLPSNLTIINKIEPQSPDIALGTTDKSTASGYNDQGVFYSSSENSTTRCGVAHFLAKSICNTLHRISYESITQEGSHSVVLGPDNKSVITLEVEKDGFTPKCVKGVTVAVAHSGDSEISEVKDLVKQVCLNIFAKHHIPVSSDCTWTINGTGRFVVHGNISDCSMTGRKISVTHPSAGPCWSNKMIGGGSLCKCYHASDFMLNIAARFVSNVLVASGLTKFAQVAVSCGIGQSKPQSVQIYGDDKFMRKHYKRCQEYFANYFDWSIAGLTEKFHLFDDFNLALCVTTHYFGNEDVQPWESEHLIMSEVEDLLSFRK